MTGRTYRVGIDVGGTFTDGVMIDTATGDFQIAKVPTTNQDPSIGFLNCVRRLLDQNQATPLQIDSIIHGTTVATNAIFQMQLARTGLITNEGFTDILEVGRMDRPKLYDLLQQRPTPLVPGRWRRGVRCRIDAQGNVVQDIVVSDVEDAVRIFKRDEIEAIAICFLHSYKNPIHETTVAEIVSDLYPNVPISISSTVVPLHGETARMSTTVINAGLAPIVGQYLENVENGLRAIGFEGELYILQSNGGTIRSREARHFPAWLIESGPAAGVIGAAHLGKQLGISNIISFDMGGTTAKVGLVKDGHPEITTEFEVGSMVRTQTYETGGGYPMKAPAIDLAEVGAGGGSIGWIDAGGALRVGPQSAGAVPGPACYDNGGNEPTVTDANLIVAKLNAANFLGGEMQLREDLAEQAISEKLARRLGKSVRYAAQGVIDVADANMERILKVVSSMRGYDPRDYAVVAFGGSGPVHIGTLADQLHIGTVIIPPSPGVFTSFGLLYADVKHDYTQAQIQREDVIDLDRVNKVYAHMEQQGRDTLQAEGVSHNQVEIIRSADLRYVGQLYTITVPAPPPSANDGWVSDVVQGFHAAHDRLYGHSAPSEPVELVALRLTALGSLVKPRIKQLGAGAADSSIARTGHRAVLFSKAQEPIETAVYDRSKLQSGNLIQGPAVVEQLDSTVIIPPNYNARVDALGNLILKRTA